MSATYHPSHTSDLPVLGATTVSYYLVQDLVRTPWRRRAAGAAVLGAGVAAAYATRGDTVATTSERSATVDRVAPDSTGHGDAGDTSAPTDRHAAPASANPRRIALLSGVFVGTLALGTWLTSRIDRAAVRGVASVGGRLPLIGRVVRRFPATTWGALQFGTVAAVQIATQQGTQRKGGK
ncbi:hypothetical protein, partial [uncultured Corynebacterium sp.]|uniref:hypothetical protein n=1 Tax=uncultured Corynebacterium sp. TaxID=159447 RepID=UPI0025F127D6